MTGRRAPALPVGPHTVSVEKTGFKTFMQQGLTLEVETDLVVNATLEVGETTQTVTVTEEAPLVDTTNSTLGTLMNEQKIENLPLNGRNYTELAFLQPGVTQFLTLRPIRPMAAREANGSAATGEVSGPTCSP